MSKYIVRLNKQYITEYSFRTGAMDFGEKDDALRFDSADEAMDALVDVVWGGDDEPPEIEEVEE